MANVMLPVCSSEPIHEHGAMDFTSWTSFPLFELDFGDGVASNRPVYLDCWVPPVPFVNFIVPCGSRASLDRAVEDGGPDAPALRVAGNIRYANAEALMRDEWRKRLHRYSERSGSEPARPRAAAET